MEHIYDDCLFLLICYFVQKLVIEFNEFEKSETSIGLVWPAGQARPQATL